MAKIGLSMIVKNEAKVILRCLESVAPLVDFVCVSDTGSADGTQEIIRNFLASRGIDGVVYDDVWQDFATNRNIALYHLHKESIDYAFMIDADDTLEIAPGFNPSSFKALIDRDIYDIPVRHGSMVHSRPQIFRNHPNYRWVGVLHEYLQAPDEATRATELGLTIHASIEGSRNADPKKFEKDAEILEKAIKTEKNDYLRARYIFYLAQSYRDSTQYEKARIRYAECAKMGFWDQQVYVSCLEAIRCCIKLGGEFEHDFVLHHFNLAKTAIPSRFEAHYAMAFLFRQVGKNREAMEVSNLNYPLTQPPDGLFLEPWIYQYALRDEYAVNAFWAGKYLESLRANIELLGDKNTPYTWRDRIKVNANVCVDRLTARFVSTETLVFSD